MVGRTNAVAKKPKYYLYKNGTEYTDRTGGWEIGLDKESNNPTLNKETDYLSFNSNNNSGWETGWFITTNEINLSRFTSLKILMDLESNDTHGDARFGITSSKSISADHFPPEIVEKRISISETQKIETLDITDINEGYVMVGALQGSSQARSVIAKYYEVWLE